MSEQAIFSIYAKRAEMQATMRAMVQQAARWHNMADGAYAAGYYAGYIDAVRQIAASIEVDAGIDDRLTLEAQ